MEAKVSIFFRSGAGFFIIAGLCFLASAITAVRYYLMTGNWFAASSGGTVAVGVVIFVLGILVRSKNTR